MLVDVKLAFWALEADVWTRCVISTLGEKGINYVRARRKKFKPQGTIRAQDSIGLG